MTADEVRQIAAWLEASNLDTLELVSPQMRLRLVTGCAPAAATCLSPAPSCIEARHAGVFLPAHPWQDAPLVRPGQHVRAGEVVALLRVGSLLQPVTADADGTVGHCLTTPGALVGFGAPLFAFSRNAPGDRSSP